jgi:hypothetical protein
MTSKSRVATARNQDLVTIAGFNNHSDAQLAKALLKDSGISSVVADAPLVMAHCFIANAVGGVILCTDAAHSRQALALLKKGDAHSEPTAPVRALKKLFFFLILRPFPMQLPIIGLAAFLICRFMK